MAGTDEVFMDIPQVENMAKSFHTFHDVLDGVCESNASVEHFPEGSRLAFLWRNSRCGSLH